MWRETSTAHNQIKVSKDHMQNSERDPFDGRLKTASQAKQKQLERFKVAAIDPVQMAKRAQRHAEAAAREAQRKAEAAPLLQEKESLERQDAEAADNEASRTTAGDEEPQAKRAKAADPEITREAERKAERDRRYAARRNRKR